MSVRSVSIVGDTRSMNNFFHRRGGIPIALADGKYSIECAKVAATGAACDIERTWIFARVSSALAYANRRVRCPMPAPLLDINNTFGRSGLSALDRRSGVGVGVGGRPEGAPIIASRRRE